MERFAEIHRVERLSKPVVAFEEESEGHPHHHLPTLEDTQRRACEIHHDHGTVTGGYALDEWLEAEHHLVH